MAAGSGYILNYDFWNVRFHDNGVSSWKRFSKGDVLDGVDLPDDQLDEMLAGMNPMLLKKSEVNQDGTEQDKKETPAPAPVVTKK